MGVYQTLLLVLILQFEFELLIVHVQVDVHLLNFIDTDCLASFLT